MRPAQNLWSFVILVLLRRQLQTHDYAVELIDHMISHQVFAKKTV